MTHQSLISTERDLRPYFKELVEGAVYHQSLEVTDVSQFYLVNMLNEFVKAEHFFESVSGHYEEPPLAAILARALDAEPPVRVKMFKKLGDISLYVAGYFSEHIDSKLVDINYYISMGEGAYKNLAGMFSGDKTFSELYEELAVKFVELVEVLSEVRISGEKATNTELMRLYERWLRTGDHRIEERLAKEGITLQKFGHQ